MECKYCRKAREYMAFARPWVRDEDIDAVICHLEQLHEKGEKNDPND